MFPRLSERLKLCLLYWPTMLRAKTILASGSLRCIMVSYYSSHNRGPSNVCESVFTAALMVCARLLWAQHGKTHDVAADIERGRSYLAMAAEALDKVDQGNRLINQCSRYIRYLSKLQDGRCKYITCPFNLTRRGRTLILRSSWREFNSSTIGLVGRNGTDGKHVLS